MDQGGPAHLSGVPYGAWAFGALLGTMWGLPGLNHHERRADTCAQNVGMARQQSLPCSPAQHARWAQTTLWDLSGPQTGF